jgi:hypothetical protein
MAPRALLQQDDQDVAFSPEEVETVTAAFEDTLRALELTNPEKPLSILIARKIFDLAKAGERDPKRLRDRTLAMLWLF